jgi:hypothetical protein
MRVSYGRSLVGTTPRKQVRSIRSKNYSIAAAVSKFGILNFKTFEGAYNGVRFRLFLNDLFEKLRVMGIERAILVMDNVSFHKMSEIRSLIELIDISYCFCHHILHN